MAEPRFLFSSQPARTVSRERLRESAWGVAQPVPTVWRLVGPNNRELGRAAQFFADERTCRQGVTALRRQYDQLQPTVWCDDTGRWVWRLDIAQRPVAVAARAYLRQRESAFNLAQFLAAVPVARIPEPQAPPAPPGLVAEAAG